jgi:hypothetical protein
MPIHKLRYLVRPRCVWQSPRARRLLFDQFMRVVAAEGTNITDLAARTPGWQAGASEKASAQRMASRAGARN